MSQLHEMLREKIAVALHEAPDPLGGALVFEDCLDLADALLAAGRVVVNEEAGRASLFIYVTSDPDPSDLYAALRARARRGGTR